MLRKLNAESRVVLPFAVLQIGANTHVLRRRLLADGLVFDPKTD